ncbi:hypothetical protein [Planctobacterium marinum]|uniref:DUF998 domain-containing protein n=1 Tax=Planctobacterium marinum TaxID=1631968 RepID=A0AA48HPA8_9ALTE|nr:hypothetical protein MACH26_39920 [Planctobacterium marinum]
MHRQINHKTMRLIIGLIAVLLAPMTWWLAEQPLSSISSSYWSDSRDIFVGSLITVGFFLSAYNGSGGSKDLEFYLSKLSCVFAIAIALFPTLGKGNNQAPPAWTESLSGVFGLIPDEVHLGASILLFACLIVMIWFFSMRAMAKGKSVRAWIYRSIAISMATGIILLQIIGSLAEWQNTTLWVEIWGLTLFGIGWLVAGAYKTEEPSAET